MSSHPSVRGFQPGRRPSGATEPRRREQERSTVVSLHFDPSILDDTVAVMWRRRLVGVEPNEKRHWRTKTAYYTAVEEILVAGAERRLSWNTIVNAVRPKGNRSTFYEVAGAHAKHPLIGEFLANQGIDAIALVLSYQR